MFNVILSALNVLLGFIFKGEAIKFALFFALFYIASEFVSLVTGVGTFPTPSAITSAMSAVPSSVSYFLDLFYVPRGLSAVISAYGFRFLIRRLPIFG